jgi:hypothetical protein
MDGLSPQLDISLPHVDASKPHQDALLPQLDIPLPHVDASKPYIEYTSMRFTKTRGFIYWYQK